MLKLPESAAAEKTENTPHDLGPNVVRADFTGQGESPSEDRGTIDVPLLGRIAAGVPISAIQHETDRLPVASDMLLQALLSAALLASTDAFAGTLPPQRSSVTRPLLASRVTPVGAQLGVRQRHNAVLLSSRLVMLSDPVATFPVWNRLRTRVLGGNLVEPCKCQAVHHQLTWHTSWNHMCSHVLTCLPLLLFCPN